MITTNSLEVKGVEKETIFEVMRAVGVYDFVLDKIKDETEVLRLFQEDFWSLVISCSE